MIEGLEMSRRRETAELCRAHAQRYDWSVLGPEFEALLQRTAGVA
jgi:hypothetical protein